MPPVILGDLSFTAGTQVRISYIALSNLKRSTTKQPLRAAFSTSKKASKPPFDRNDLQGQPFTGVYEPVGPTRGPLGQASSHGAPRITPRRLKEHLDKYVIGQERAKKMLSVAVYNHYQRVHELQRQEEEEQFRLDREARKRSVREHEVYHSDDIFLPAKRTIKFSPTPEEEPVPKVARRISSLRNEPFRNEFIRNESIRSEFTRNEPIRNEPPPLHDPLADRPGITIEKSNVMVIGPTGVGKTHILKTLARALEVPFSMSDCTPFTQAGYIGEDADVCVQRLLAAADYDVARAEHGIICLDEVDKLAVSRSMNGRDVGGEGVQQALLKIVEGTTLTITAKHDQKSNRAPGGSPANVNFTANSAQPTGNGQKPESYTINTDNILFIFTGAFVGLQKMIMNRLSKGSLGFGASVRNTPTSPHQMTMNSEDARTYFKNLPFYTDIPTATSATTDATATTVPEQTYNPLDLATPQDLQTFGLIPEFLGRIPVTVALAPLSLPNLVSILTEPRDAITAQYTAMFATFGTELRFTTAALYAIAQTGLELGTGARGLRTAVEMLLGEAMYEVPGSSVRYVLVDARAARREGRVGYWSRGKGGEFVRAWEMEEKEWADKEKREKGREDSSVSFEALRESAGSGM
ncbi:hypothetical protein VE01_03069 [Pseudogymnoascus verrucosus]|uniref:Uncharacterized protein n=1 Tax=Pseudogymnoascus verrucosus TaxID=342668 RepID=A0A1B8GRI3_9PEZI|nr:uncharacterized protein VE01_03069 [Pseudogymnoascus verrucosus]OBT98437.1 hypothetical protein VE01_03069 [Pseudogymnoascus verrucosus]